MGAHLLLENQSTNTTAGTEIEVHDYNGTDPGRTLFVEGTLDGATVAFVQKPTYCSNFVPMLPTTNSEFTTTGTRIVNIRGKSKIKANLSGVGGSTDVTVGVSD